MKNIVKKVPAIAFMLAIIAAFAFKAPAEFTADYYFEWDGSSTGAYISNPLIVCPLTSGDECAMGFDEEHVDTSVNPPVLKPYVLDEPDDFDEDQRFKTVNL